MQSEFVINPMNLPRRNFTHHDAVAQRRYYHAGSKRVLTKKTHLPTDHMQTERQILIKAVHAIRENTANIAIHFQSNSLNDLALMSFGHEVFLSGGMTRRAARLDCLPKRAGAGARAGAEFPVTGTTNS